VRRFPVAYNIEEYGYKSSHAHIKDESSDISTRNEVYGGGISLVIFSSDELRRYASDDLCEQQYQYIRCIKRDNRQGSDLDEVNDVHCSVPLDILVPKLTLKFAKELANLHDMYMPSKILQKDALILLENHKCETCPDLLAVFKPYKAASNAQYQQTWYQRNKDKCAKYNKLHAERSDYQELNKNSSQKHYQSKRV